MFLLFQIFDPESIMSSGMFDLLHGVSCMTEFSLIEQLGYQIHVFFQRVPAADRWCFPGWSDFIWQ